MPPTSEISFDSLAYIDIESILNCFNESFRNYFVALQLTKEQLLERLYVEGVNLTLSFGAFHNKTLVGFILNAIDTVNSDKVAHNSGTGVLPAYRGQGISLSLYEYCIDELKNKGIAIATLEAFVENIPAVKIYERMGFAIVRKLVCYRGNSNCQIDSSIELENILYPEWNEIDKLCEWQRSWQYNNQTLSRAWNNYSMLGAYVGTILMAYCIVNFKNGRIANFGVVNKESHRYLSAIFAYIEQSIDLPLTIINIDKTSSESNQFLKEIGLEYWITSYEMERKLTCNTTT